MFSLQKSNNLINMVHARSLKLVPSMFYIFEQMIGLKNYEKCFLFHLKTSSHAWEFSLSFHTLPDSKGLMKVE